MNTDNFSFHKDKSRMSYIRWRETKFILGIHISPYGSLLEWGSARVICFVYFPIAQSRAFPASRNLYGEARGDRLVYFLHV